MPITISTNVTATFSNRVLGTNRAKALRSQEHIAQGSRIVHGADDAAGFSISEKNKASLRSLRQAERNAQDAFGFINTADGALSEAGNILIRLRELAVQAASDTIGDGERAMLEKEVHGLKEELQGIADATEYNGVHLLNGSVPRFDLQVGLDSDPESSRITIHPPDFAVGLERLGLADLSLLSKPQAREAMARLDEAQNYLSGARSTLGAVQNRLEATRTDLANYRLNLGSAESRIRDADMAEEVSELTKHNLITNANAAALSQINQAPGQALKLLGGRG